MHILYEMDAVIFNNLIRNITEQLTVDLEYSRTTSLQCNKYALITCFATLWVAMIQLDLNLTLACTKLACVL